MITWNERKTGNHWDAYAGPVHMEIFLLSGLGARGTQQHSFGVWVNDCWLRDELTFGAAKEAALRYALAELDCIIEQCQDAKYEIGRMGL